jgi:hypothetical protein
MQQRKEVGELTEKMLGGAVGTSLIKARVKFNLQANE